MKHLLSAAMFAALFVTGNAQQQIEAPSRIQNFILDPAKEIELPVGQRHATVIYFPKPVDGVIGYGLTEGKEAGTFQFSHPKGSNVVTLRNVDQEKDCYMTCLMDKQPYIFHLVPSKEPVITVKLAAAEEAKATKFHSVSSAVVSYKRLEYTTASLIQSIRKARSRTVWEQTYPEWYEDTKRRQTQMATDTKTLSANISEIHQFPSEDTLVFLGTISNKTDEALWLQPQGLRIRVGERLYPAQMVDFTGEIESKGKTTFSIVLRGNSTGSREHLSINNEFRVVMPEALDPSCLAQSTADLSEDTGLLPTILPQK